MWTTFSKQQSTQKILIPGEFNSVTTVTVPADEGGIELVPLDAVNTVRFVNLSVAPTADSNGDPISIYIGTGIVPTPTLYSNEMLSGQNEYNLQINGQKIMAICETGKTLAVNVQIANAIVKTL
ncbi:MAG: hypothetical protein I4E98_08585 [Planktothrix agardhii KL2]|jgi:hypothetical protein|uniref:hypothetical protein n=1 Tax=Planktothrix agardhii TaxID=1160 RepID=UPI001A2DE177|nr:hypothetical protein [Planktothrix agardhii]MBG0746636.1 hypothetical protein [Planktothrix agardhii KL2]